ncbi:asparagine synthase-related protein [Hyphomonas sp.]|uniref:asparagine synthase-related protein n=1 Tax=Hyphomonas sp. TaxID=87 RepID=UPI00356A9876
MPSFAAMIWNAENPEACSQADTFHHRIKRMPDRAEGMLIQAGFALYDLSAPGCGQSILRLEDENGEGQGAIFGTLFRTGDTGVPSSVVHLARQDVSRLCLSRGKALVQDYWGRYVAFLTCPDAYAIIVDPTAALPCYYARFEHVTVVFSHLERCHFLDTASLSINMDHVSTLLAYDKIQNGETGLNEISELLGGQRLLVSGTMLKTDRIWDPRMVALDVLEPPIEVAAAALKLTTQHVVAAWGLRHRNITVSLSGGLDSTIVLHCLAASCDPSRLSALHYILDSGDAPESHYAQLAAERAGCTLREIRVAPQAGLHTLGRHPPTVRPYRQFLSPDLVTDVPGGALFTGQGGDHLFRVSQSPLGFADHVLLHGLGSGTAGTLLDSARLSGQSIWRVLGETLPLLLGEPHTSAMVAALKGRETVINHHAQAKMDPDSVLPDWVREPLGLPPAKFDQVSILMHMTQMRDVFFTDRPIETVHPLISQPLIELCLRLPTYLLSCQGTSRGLVRRAFRNVISDQIRLRMNKGHASRYFTDRVTAYRGPIIEALMEGELARRGLIQRSDVESFVRREDYRMQDSGSLLLAYYAMESWLQTWTAITGKPVSRT